MATKLRTQNQNKNRLILKLLVGLTPLLMAILSGLLFIGSSPSVFADCGGIKTVVVSCNQQGVGDSEDTGLWGLLLLTINILAAGVGVLALFGVAYGAIRWTTAKGEVAAIQQAISIFRNVVIGVLCFGGMFTFANWLVPGGLFDAHAHTPSSNSSNASTKNNTENLPSKSTIENAANKTPASGKSASTSVSIATYNLRLTILTPWDSTRANSIYSYMKTIDVIGTQEGSPDSVTWLTNKLKQDGYARTNHKWSRQIFWNTKKFSLIKQGAKELPNNKDLVWVQLRDKASKRSFFVVTNHPSVDSSAKRTQEIRIALNYIASTLRGSPVLYVGDFNSEIGSSQERQIRAAGYRNSYAVAASKTNISYRTTLSGFHGGLSGTIDTSSKHQIDHIFLKGDVTASRIAIVAHKGSDHLPVQAIVNIGAKP